jgi:hypothetical protein
LFLQGNLTESQVAEVLRDMLGISRREEEDIVLEERIVPIPKV